MLTIYDLKPKFQNLLRPIVQWLADKHIRPNQVTWSALFLSGFLGAFIYFSNGAAWSLLLLPVGLFIRMGLNAIDGMLAREHDMQTKEGAMLNEMTDVIADSFIYLAFVSIPLVEPSLIVLFVIISIFTEMAGIVGQAINNDRRYDGPMGKSDRAFTIGLAGVLIALELINEEWLLYYLLLAILLSVMTLYNRMKKGTQ
ncbi:membrane protein [Marinomonas sp. SBI22]|uniref:CDP-alcohol phosphatidyltransferase family protein n=1 Tax=unclassified Marinomonas TaxID=196814 RepID=UPI0007AF806E|nr:MULTISPECIES: CDP-alcohol phosphatidyltransferase family protein [unclassified Marinomonas]KZM43629.1 membrane protein [Marinomonas sp. SBI22]KZM47191.1 membrane protein [Marinomonas sp. SBI8L]